VSAALEFRMAVSAWLLLSLLAITVVKGHDRRHPGSRDDRLTLEEELEGWGARQTRGTYSNSTTQQLCCVVKPLQFPLETGY